MGTGYKVLGVTILIALAEPWVLAGLFAYIIWASRLASSLVGYGP